MKQPITKNTIKNKKLSIAFVLDDGLDKPDGVQQNILTLGTWLDSKGHNVKYLVGETKRKDIKNVISMSRNLKVVFNGNTLTIPLFSSKKNINDVLDKNNFDIIHVQVPYSPMMGARVINRAYKKSVIIGTFHIMPNNFLSSAGTRILGLYLSFNLKKFDKQFAVSKPAAKFAKKTFKIKASVLGNPIDTKKFKVNNKKSSKNGRYNIVFLGRLVPRKGCLELVKAIKILINSDLTNFELNIAGDGPERKKIEQYISQNNLSEYVHLHGFIDEKDKKNFYASADIAVFPSSGGESFGIVLLEAMASGSGVVLAGDNVGYRSVLSDIPETLFSPNDPIELTKLLKRIMKSDELQIALHEKQSVLVKNFDVEKIGEELLKKYYKTLEAKNVSLQ